MIQPTRRNLITENIVISTEALYSLFITPHSFLIIIIQNLFKNIFTAQFHIA